MGGALTSLDFVPQDYKIKYIDSMNKSSKEYNKDSVDTKGKLISVMIEKDCILDIILPESDLTVGWLLSEVTRRYNEILHTLHGHADGDKVIVGLKTVESIPALDYYLTQLENSLSQINDKLLVAHFAETNIDWNHIRDSKVSKNDFHFLKVIGWGGYSNVVLARKKDNGKLYAIKIIKKDATYLKTNKSIYIAEANIMRKLSGSPFIVNLHYTFQTENELYFAMDPWIGGTLFHFFTHSARGSLNKNIVKFYMSEIIIALEKIHLKNIMYRDLKPENILIDIDGHIKLSDFGLSKQIRKRDETSATFWGSPEYLPPEMILGIDHSRAVDFYTLGCLLYEMIVGFPPFHSKSNRGLDKRIVSGVIWYPPNIDSDAQDLMEWLLERDPEWRPKEFSELKQHPFFKDIHWGRIAKKQAIPPWIPDLYQCHAPKKFTNIPLNRVFHKQKLFKESNNASYNDKQTTKDEFDNSVYIHNQNSNREPHNIKNKLNDNIEESMYLEGI